MMTLSRPYLLRAIYEWLVDNENTPYLLVNAEYEDVMVPYEHVNDGKIILNISPIAVDVLNLENDSVSFSARFSGKLIDIYIPIQAVLALYSMENGKGMMFPEEEDGIAEESPVIKEVEKKSNEVAKKVAKKGNKKTTASFLKVVK